MRSRILLILIPACSVLMADRLTLKNGQEVEGIFFGGDARQIRMAVGDKLQSYPIHDVQKLEFGSPQEAEPSKPVAEVKPAAQAKTAAQAKPATSVAVNPATVSVGAPVVSGSSETAAGMRTARSGSATAPASSGKVIPAGTAIVVRLIDDVDSQRDTVGQKYRASLDEPVMVDGVTLIPRGVDVTVKLVEDKESGRLSGRSELTLDIQSITFEGREVEVATQEVTMAGESRTGQTARRVGGLAAVGAVIGAIAGGGKGAAIGAAAGAGTGTAVQVATKGASVKIPSESRLQFTLQQPIRL